MTVDALPESPPIDGFTKLYDYDDNGNLIYEGWARAQLGASQSGAFWVIRRNTYNGGNQLTTQQWANGNTQTLVIWANRTTLSYQ
jgi:hypothetical protein